MKMAVLICIFFSWIFGVLLFAGWREDFDDQYFAGSYLAPETGTWNEVAGLPIGCQRGVVEAIGGFLFYISGDNPELTTARSTNVFRYNGTSWESVGPIPKGTRFAASGVANGKIYYYGGMQTLNLTNAYEFDGSSWVAIAPLPVGMRYHTGGALEDQVFSFGGWYYGTKTNVYSYNGTWSHRANLPFALTRSASGVIGTNLYLAGGDNNDASPITNVFLFNGSAWVPLAPFPHPRYDHQGASLNGKIYFIGGSTPSATNVVDVFDGTNWFEATPLPINVAGHRVGVLNGKIYVCGGSGLLTNVWEYTPGTQY